VSAVDLYGCPNVRRIKNRSRELFCHGRLAAVTIFLGFHLTFFPQFVLGYLGMPRRYHAYPPEFQVLNVMSTAGASILAVGYFLPLIYLIWSLRYGAVAGMNPWRAIGLEWQTPSPPPTDNFEETPIVTREPYDYARAEAQSEYAPRVTQHG
jgi:cytochrome c oxidase subunit I